MQMDKRNELTRLKEKVKNEDRKNREKLMEISKSKAAVPDQIIRDRQPLLPSNKANV